MTALPGSRLGLARSNAHLQEVCGHGLQVPLCGRGWELPIPLDTMFELFARPAGPLLYTRVPPRMAASVDRTLRVRLNFACQTVVTVASL